MKLSISALISAVFLFGLVTMGVAQTDLSPAPSKAPPSAPSSEPAKPSSEPAKPSQDVKTDNRSTTVESRSDSSGRSDGGSALPRAATERNAIFGLSPTAAIIVGGALLLIVILAIVALGRGGSTDIYVDGDRRM